MHHFDYSQVDNPGYESARRLTHREYANAVRDLLGIEDDVLSRFPSDLSATSGFDNSANSLFLQPLLMQRYLQVAEFVSEQAAISYLENPNPGSLFLQPARMPEDVTPGSVFRRQLELFLPLAFRRKVTSGELATYQGLFERSYSRNPDWMQASKSVLRSILVSPNFLFRVESAVEGQKDYRVSDWDLASRLSFFLWSSVPDTELLERVSEGKLKTGQDLKEQVLRMLADEKSTALGDVFASQWLGFEHLGTRIRADPIDNPWCTDSLMESMKQESSLFFRSLVQENRPARDLLMADYTFVNAELAKHYRMSGVRGEEMRRVKAPANRGGILGHASVLAVTSYPYQTSPVKRGTWVLSDLLGTPPPPPPPGASSFEEELEENDRLSFKQKLKKHSTLPQCASCHRKIDPLGFGLENFDWFGRYRTRGGGGRIDNTGSLPDGSRFAGLPGLKKVLVEKRMDEIARNMIRKLLSFALSRQLEYYDEKTVLEIVARTRANQYRLGDIVLEIVQSNPFQRKRVQQIKSIKNGGNGTGERSSQAGPLSATGN
ncbi:MAG: DUF1592 domain-containing protein [Planctomycetota bacterium]|nr:DUF1592 domain-containing protein [Planctomycetota bacterium]